jgi:hypothetical protein
MNASNNNSTRGGLRGWWASPPRTGIRRTIAPWEYRHLRGSGLIRIAGGSFLVLAGPVPDSGRGEPRRWLLVHHDGSFGVGAGMRASTSLLAIGTMANRAMTNQAASKPTAGSWDSSEAWRTACSG